MFNFIKKYWYLLLSAPIFSLILFFNGVNSQVKDNQETFYTVKKETVKDVLSLSGKINADEKAILRFQTSGRLAWVGVKKGDYVKKYQAIASLDQRDVRKNLQKKLNTFIKERWDFDQEKEDQKDKAVTDAMRRILDKAQYDLNNSVIDVELQNLSVEYSNLITPIEGIVTDIGSPYAGVNVSPTQAEFTIVNPKTVYFSVWAEQTEVVKLKNRMKGEIVFDSFPDNVVNGEIKNISFSPVTSDNTYEVRMAIKDDNGDFKYRIGMTGDVDFVLSEKSNVISIPTTKIQTERNKKYVYKLQNNKKIKTYIKVGEETDGNTEIISGLKDGDIITN